MTYQALARKWRPQDFSSVVGQQPIVTALRNALTDERIAQAFLFSGIRGVGKTSVARVLAKALNCERGPAADPCNECTPCREITRGADLDVLEVDAATYSKVEQVRDLTESLRYGPARNRYKVVVLDEVHRLSRQAFDALLKIVEEPPPFLVFIFATTDIDAVPATILSRCQEYRFRRVPTPALHAHLRTLSEAEGIAVSDAALVAIARAGEGSVRDAVALLDQLATYGNGAIADEEAERVLGGVGAAFCQAVLEALIAGDRGRVVSLGRQVEEEGQDPRHVHAQLLTYCRAALHLATGADTQWLDLPAAEREALAPLVAATGYENLLRLLHHLLASEPTVRRSEVPSLALEIAWLRAAELPRLVDVEALLASSPAAAPDADRRSRLDSPTPSPARRQEPTPESSPKRSPEPAQRPASRQEVDTPAPEPAPPQGTADTRIAKLLEEVNRRRAPLAARLQEAAGLEVENGQLVISHHPGDPGLERALARSGDREALEMATERVFGEALPWKLVESREPSGGEGGGEAGRETDLPASAAEHPTVQAVLDIFGGTVERIETRRQGK